MNITSITGIEQFGFSAFLNSPSPPANAIAGWTAVSASPGNTLISMANASPNATEQLFNCYLFNSPSITQGQGLMLQSLTNGKYVVAQSTTIDGQERTTFAAIGSDRDKAALFGYYSMGANQALSWYDSSSNQWYGLVNLASTNNEGNGVLAASSQANAQPYLLPWQASKSASKWSYTPPAGWGVTPGSDLSWVDFTTVSSSEFPFDFTGCKLNQTNLSGKTFGHAYFVNCDLSTAQVNPPLGASPTSWIDLTGATINYPSLGPDWRYLNLTRAAIIAFPSPPAAPPLINAAGAILDFVNMLNWNLLKADFTGAQMYNTNLNGSYLNGAKFHGAKLSPIGASDPSSDPSPVPANLAYAYLFDVDFTGANLQGVSFANAFLYGKDASVSGASLRGTDFTNACLPEMVFSGVYEKDLVGANFDGSCLVNANFSGTVMGQMNNKGFSFVGAALQGTNFTASNLNGANLTNAAIAIDTPPQGGSKIPVTRTFTLGGITVKVEPITYTQKTILATTDQSTYCPSQTGPCTGAKLNPNDPSQSPLNSWPAVSKANTRKSV